MILRLRKPGLGDLERLDRVAAHLNLRSGPEDDRFADDVIRAVLRRLAPIVAEAEATTGEDIMVALAETLDVKFEAVRTPHDIVRVRDHYTRSERQLGFAQLDDELADPQVDALLFQLTPRPDEDQTRYVAVLNLQRGSSREFWNKGHELTHRIIEPPQKFLPFRRHPSERTSPIERLVDAVTAETAFYQPLFVPIVHRFDIAKVLTFGVVRSVRRLYAPTASFLSVANAVVRHWCVPAMLLTGECRGRRGAPHIDIALRVEVHSRNKSAETIGLNVFPNMRVPLSSPLFAAFHESREVSDAEDLGAWTTSTGQRLPGLPVHTSAVRLGNHAYAILTASDNAPRVVEG